MACFVYVLGCVSAAGPRTYVGWTNDLEQRLRRHNAGAGAKSTRGRVWSLLYVERYDTKSEAMSREWRLKRDAALRRELRLCVGAESLYDGPSVGNVEPAANVGDKSGR